MKKVKPFEPQEKGYMVIDNSVFDVIMPSLNPTTWKVLCFIMRKTEGWNKEWDGLSYSQIMKGTNIKSTATISKTLKELLSLNYIRCNKTEGQWDPNRYALNTALEIEVGNGSALENEVDANLENKAESALKSKDTTIQVKLQEKDKREAAEKMPPAPSLREQAQKGKMTSETEMALLTGYGRQGNAGIADPSHDKEQFYRYRDKAIQVVKDITKVYPNETQRGEIAELSAQPDFDVDLWQQSIRSCEMSRVRPGNVECYIDTYRAGGDYAEMCRERKNGGKPNARPTQQGLDEQSQAVSDALAARARGRDP